MASPTKAVFLDRDGTLIVDAGYAHRIEDLVLLPGVVDGLRTLQERGFALLVLTNQSGIARGFFTEEDYERFTAELLRRLEAQGVSITAVYHCPHLEGCNCRKPMLGMFEQAREEWNVDYLGSYAIGDKMRDLAICERFPVAGMLLGASEKPQELDFDGVQHSGKVYGVSDFASAVELLVALEDGERHDS